jgi:cation-transporting ATPase I
MTRPVVVTGVASAAVLALIVQTPGLSHAFGCRPLGPVGWLTAAGASAAATAGAAYVPDLWARFRSDPSADAVAFQEAPTLIG